MISGVCIQPMVPLRSNPSEKSEMVTQMLFGERFLLIKTDGSWSEVRLLNDGYKGWCTTKMLNLLPGISDDFFVDTTTYICKSIVKECFFADLNFPFYISAGSILYKDNNSGLYFIPKCDGKNIIKSEVLIKNDFENTAKNISDISMQFLNVPYLWGGKTLMGIDCSGFVQIVFSIAGFSVPRDASEQALIGENIDFDKLLSGDLAFFSNENNNIVHVGICLGENKIIHASGNVHIDILNQNGIYSSELSVYTHKLSHIKRIYT